MHEIPRCDGEIAMCSHHPQGHPPYSKECGQGCTKDVEAEPRSVAPCDQTGLVWIIMYKRIHTTTMCIYSYINNEISAYITVYKLNRYNQTQQQIASNIEQDVVILSSYHVIMSQFSKHLNIKSIIIEH